MTLIQIKQYTVYRLCVWQMDNQTFWHWAESFSPFWCESFVTIKQPTIFVQKTGQSVVTAQCHVFWWPMANFNRTPCATQLPYTPPHLIHTLARQQAFSSLALCLALFKLSPLYTNSFASAKLFHMLLACPIYSTLTICSQQLLNGFLSTWKPRYPNLNPIIWLNNSI